MGSLLSESKTRPVSAPDSALTVVEHVPIQTQQAQNVLRINSEARAGFWVRMGSQRIAIRPRDRGLLLDRLLLRGFQRVAKRSRNVHRD